MHSRTWLTTDTHFGHRKLIDKGFRPHDYESRIITNWNNHISPIDHVIHLGDLFCGDDDKIASIINMLNGTKCLVRGNHDNKSRSWYRQNGFTDCVDAIICNGALLTHEPYQGIELPIGCNLNIHGHLHDDNHRRHDYEIREWHKLLAIELTEYRPVLLEKFSRV